MDGGDEAAPLVVEEACSSSVARPVKNHARDVHILSLAFLFVFSAYGAAQNLESTVNTVMIFTLSFHLALWFVDFD